MLYAICAPQDPNTPTPPAKGWHAPRQSPLQENQEENSLLYHAAGHSVSPALTEEGTSKEDAHFRRSVSSSNARGLDVPLTAPLLRLASADTSSTWAALGTRREEACMDQRWCVSKSSPRCRT